MFQKKCKAIFTAGILAGLLAFQPVFGSDLIANGATMIIRLDDNGQTHREIIDNSTPGAPQQGQDVNSGQDTGQTGGAVSQQPDAGAGQSDPAAVPGQTDPATAAGQTDPATAAGQTDPATAAGQDAGAEQTPQNGAILEGIPLEGQEGQQTADSSDSQQTPQLPAGIRALDPSRPMIALTFDDGPYAPVGNRIMDVMNQYGGKCTFFMVGNRVPSYQAEVQRMVNEGFEVANHTQDHKYLNQLGADAIRAQVEACNNTIQAVTGVRPTLMRLPGGNKNSTVLSNVNMPIILWNVDTKDWKNRNAQSVINSVMGNVKDGDIILMHELYTSTAEAVEALVPALTAQGFQLVTVSELSYYKGIALNPGQIYHSIP